MRILWDIAEKLEISYLTKEVNPFPNFICLKNFSILLSLEKIFQFFYTLENRSGCTVKIPLEKRVEEYVQQQSFINKTFNLLKTDLEHSFLNLNACMLHTMVTFLKFHKI